MAVHMYSSERDICGPLPLTLLISWQTPLAPTVTERAGVVTECLSKNVRVPPISVEDRSELYVWPQANVTAGFRCPRSGTPGPHARAHMHLPPAGL